MDVQLFDAATQFKVAFSQISMHLGREWRDKLFARLDSILDAGEWDTADLPPTVGSSLTLIRLLLILKTERVPSLGISGEGTLVAAWTNGDDRLTVECFARDQVRLVLRCKIGDELERHVATNSIGRVPKVLAPYQPERWFRIAK